MTGVPSARMDRKKARGKEDLEAGAAPYPGLHERKYVWQSGPAHVENGGIMAATALGMRAAFER